MSATDGDSAVVKRPPRDIHLHFSAVLADPYKCGWRDGAKSPTVTKDEHEVSPRELRVVARELAICLAADASLFLWADGPHLAEAVELLAAWGFAYEGNLVSVTAEGLRPVVDHFR